MKMNRTPGDLSRRKMLGLLGVAGAAALTGYPVEDSEAAQALDCVVTPQQAEGPYFVDDRLNRSDIRLDPTTKKVKEGLPLKLRINVNRVDGGACRPLPGAVVDVWQCDALGAYSDIQDFGGRFDTRGQKFLRGYQVTDRTGTAEFVTIYPGWYRGRPVHIHFKVRHGNSELTSQLYFDDALTDKVHARRPYSAKGSRDTRNSEDYIYGRGDSGSRLLLRLTPDGQGYSGAIAVGLRMS